MYGNGIRHAVVCVVFASVGMATPTLAEEGYFVGVSVVAALYDATYDKTVDNTAAHNTSMLFAGQRLHAEDSADSVTYDAGVLIGYRGSLGPLFYSIEGDLMTHRGTTSGHLEGVGTTAGRDQVGESWPEDWKLVKDKSYGLTARIGGQLPIIDTTAYMLAGIRRVDADFSRSYRGCLLLERVCTPTDLETGVEFFDEKFNAFSVGAGIEQPLDRVVVRAELRYVFHGSAAQLALFEDLGVRVPTRLEASEIGLGVSVLWTF